MGGGLLRVTVDNATSTTRKGVGDQPHGGSYSSLSFYFRRLACLAIGRMVKLVLCVEFRRAQVEPQLRLTFLTTFNP